MDNRRAPHSLSSPGITRRPCLITAAERCLAPQARIQRIADATRCLVALGHERILLVSMAGQAMALADAELQGHCQIMLAAGLPLLPRLELDEAGEPVWPKLTTLLTEVAPTALLCTQHALVARLRGALHPHAGLLGSVLVVGLGASDPQRGTTWH